MSIATEAEQDTQKEVYVSATTIQNNFSKYRKMADEGITVVIRTKGKRDIEMRKRPAIPFTEYEGILSDMPHMSTQDIKEERYQNYVRTGRY